MRLPERSRLALLVTLVCLCGSPRDVSAQLGSLIVSVSQPAAGSIVGGTIPVSANVTITGGLLVTSVRFTLDGVPLGSPDTSAPYTIPWNTRTTGNGFHTLRAVARDLLGTSWTSNPVGVTVFNDTSPPTVGLAAPTSGAALAGAVIVNATAADNVAVVGVQFRLDGTPLGAEDTSAPWAISWDTRTAANGAHALTAVARDAAGNSASSAAVTVAVDNAAPAVSLSAPSSGATVSSIVTISANASDNAGVVGVQFRLDGTNLGAEDTAAPYSISWDTRTATNGAHALTAVARDAAGNSTTSTTVTLTVDNAPPAVSLSAPTSGATVSSTIAVSANASDNVGVVGVQFRLDGANLGAEDTSAPYSVSWDTRTAPNGSHTLTAVARDAAGHVTTSGAVPVTVNNSTPDTTPPTVAITSPSAGATVSGTLMVTANAADNVGVAGVRFRLDGADLGAEDTAAPYATPWDTSAVANGAHTLTTVARDAAGNVTTSPAITVTVDNAVPDTTVPTVSITAPMAGATVSGSTTLGADASDNVGVAGVQFRIDGVNVGAEDTSAPYTVAWDTSAVANGSHTVSAIARDAAGNMATSSPVTVTVSNGSGTVVRDEETSSAIAYTGDWIQGNTGRPWSGGTAALGFAAGHVAQFTFSGTGVTWLGFRSPQAGIARVSIDGGPPTTVDGYAATETVSAAMFTATGLPNGIHVLRIEATGDKNPAAVDKFVVVDAFDVTSSGGGSGDTTAPTATVTSPAAGATVSGTITVSASASDNVGVAGVQFRLDGANLGAEDTSAPYTVPWDTRTAANGSHTLTAVARDAAGNSTTSAAVTVTVSNAPSDATPPAVSLTAPASGASVSGIIAVSADASDDVGVVGVQFRLDGAAIGPEDTTPPYAVPWDTRTTTNGSHTLTAVARDAAGNSATSTAVTVTVANTGGSTIRLEDGNTAITYQGAWNQGNAGRPWSGGTAAIGFGTGQQATLDFRGTGVNWIGFRANWAGIANVYVDGVFAAAVDAYAETETVGATMFAVSGLPLGPHTLTIEVTRTRNPASSDFVVVVDAFDVIDTPADTTAPSIAVTSPADGSTVFGTVPIVASAADNAGVASVTFFVDGAQVGPVDAISPHSVNWNTTAVADGAHTLTASARDAAGNTMMSPPVTVIVSNAAPPVTANATRVESTATSIVYTDGCATCGQVPGWFHGSRSRDWSGGTASFNRSDGARATFTFTGTAVSWIGFRAAWAGIARVFVDGAFVTEVDLFSTTEQARVPVFQVTDLTPGVTHTIAVESTGRKNAEAADYAVVVDAFDVSPAHAPAVEGTRVEETAPSATFTAGWTQGDASQPWSGGTAAVSSGAGERVTFVFTGTSVRWIGRRAPTMGIARVYLDGVFHATVDTYAPVRIQTAVYGIAGLEVGQHRLEVEVTGLRNTNATDHAIVVDAFDVDSRIEEADLAVTYSGTWGFDFTDRNWSGTSLTMGSGTAARSATAGARAEFSFVGTSVSWIGYRAPWVGIADVYLDGAFAARVDLYAPAEQVQVPVFTATGLAPGPHTLRIEVTGTKNAASTTALVMVDAFDVSPVTPAPPVTRVQETDSRIAYTTGGWRIPGRSPLWSGETAVESVIAGAQATFTFTGTSVRWLGERGFGTGVARVLLDGVFLAQVDTRTTLQEEYQRPLVTVTGLTPGAHTLTIEVVGRNNEAPGATVERVVVDAFEIK